MSECKNCDRPCSGVYCSNLCEDMDRHPAPRDDMERFTEPMRRPADAQSTRFATNPNWSYRGDNVKYKEKK